MSYRIVQPQKNGRFYLYQAESVWNPEKKSSVQKRTYLGACDKDGNLLEPTTKNRTILCSPVYGTGYLLHSVMKDIGLDKVLEDVYGERDGKRLEALAILGIIDPSSVRMMECNIGDSYIRELVGTEWSFEQSEVCRFMQSVGKDFGKREEVFEKLAPKNGCVIFDIVCLGTDSGELDFSEPGRKARFTGSKQFNLGIVHSMSDGLPFMYRTYPGSVADVSTLDNITDDLSSIGCKPIELIMDRGFFSYGNISDMVSRETGFTVPIPGKNAILKLLISESIGNIDSPLMTDMIGGSVVRGYETAVAMNGREFVRASSDDADAIRAVVLQDDTTRANKIETLYRRLTELEKKLDGTEYRECKLLSLTNKEKEILSLFNVSTVDGKVRLSRKRNAISAKENACGRFVLLTTSDKGWKDLMVEYRSRNDIEYDFSELQSNLFNGVKGKSDQNSAEGGLFVSFLSLRLRTALLNRMRLCKMTETMWITDIIGLMRKLKISNIGGKWRLNEVTKAQRETFGNLGIEVPR